YVNKCMRCKKKKYALVSRPRDNARRLEIRQAIIDAKSRPCTDCRVQYPYYVMHFDHLPGFEKLFNIGSSVNRGMENVLKEMAKCEVVCGNCHAERTFQRLPNNRPSGKKSV